MSVPLHPARTIPFDDLIEGLDRAYKSRLLYRRSDQTGCLQQFTYSPRCVYEDAWDDFTLLARGLIIEPAARRIVATPFPKFFNLGERHGDVPNAPFEAFEKLDGSLIIVFHYAGTWHAATKGSFHSEQAVWAQSRLDDHDLSGLTPGTTYLFEAVYPENRIIVRYHEPALVSLAAYDESGRELDFDEIMAVGNMLGWRAAQRQPFQTITELIAKTTHLPRSEEGFVVRFATGLRLKLKGAEYRRIHALISRCTPLALWEMIAKGDDLDAIRRDIPEEFWTDWDEIIRLLHAKASAVEARIADYANRVGALSDKELGLALSTLPADVRPYIFAYRKTNSITGKSRDTLLRDIRPTGNRLEGYVPSYAMGRIMDEAGP